MVCVHFTWSGGTTLCRRSSLLAMAAHVDSSQQSPRMPWDRKQEQTLFKDLGQNDDTALHISQ